MNTDLIETISAAVHDEWMAEQRRRGRTSSVGRDGEEYMVPYAQLSEAAKELDRVTVRAVLKHLPPVALAAQQAPQPVRGELERIEDSYTYVRLGITLQGVPKLRDPETGQVFLSADVAQMLYVAGQALEALSAPQPVPDDEEVLGKTATGYTLTRDYLWGPNGDAVVEVVNGRLEVHPDLMEALELLPPRFQYQPQPAPDAALREALAWYADEANWVDPYPDTWGIEQAPAIEDGGAKARAALGEG